MEQSTIDLNTVLNAVEETQREFLSLVKRPDALEVLHCRGCHNHCALATPNCGRGARAAMLVRRYKDACAADTFQNR